MSAEQAREALVAVRMERGLTQAQVAERMGISTSVYQKIEYGTKGKVQLGTLERLAAALGLEVEVTIRERGKDAGQTGDRASGVD